MFSIEGGLSWVIIRLWMYPQSTTQPYNFNVVNRATKTIYNDSHLYDAHDKSILYHLKNKKQIIEKTCYSCLTKNPLYYRI